MANQQRCLVSVHLSDSAKAGESNRSSRWLVPGECFRHVGFQIYPASVEEPGKLGRCFHLRLFVLANSRHRACRLRSPTTVLSACARLHESLSRRAYWRGIWFSFGASSNGFLLSHKLLPKRSPTLCHFEGKLIRSEGRVKMRSDSNVENIKASQAKDMPVLRPTSFHEPQRITRGPSFGSLSRRL